MSLASDPSAEPVAPAESAPSTVTTHVDIAAPPEDVFEALTDPDQLAEWWGSDESYRTRDWTVEATPGGTWGATTIGPDGEEGSLGGTFIEVDAPRVLETTWRTSWDDVDSIVRWELAPVEVDGEAGTRLTVIHTGPSINATACLAYAAALALHPCGPRTADRVPGGQSWHAVASEGF